jgi:hypothetical protein
MALDLLRDEVEEATLLATASELFPGDPLAVFALNYLWKQTGLARRDHDEWRA